MRWAGHVAHVRKTRGTYRVWRGKLKERNHLEDLWVDGRILLKCIFKEWAAEGGGMDWIDSAGDMDSWWAVVNVGISLQVP